MQAFAKKMIDVSIVERSNDKLNELGQTLYKIQGKKGIVFKDTKGNSDLSGGVIQFTKKVNYAQANKQINMISVRQSKRSTGK